MKKLTVIIFSLSIIAVSCSVNDKEESGSEGQSNKKEIPVDKQLNISILLDLSDRLERDLQPPQSKRDIQIVKSTIKIFKKDMEEKGAFLTKGKLRVLFTPPPNDPNINNLAKKLNIDLTDMHNKKKKEVYDNIQTKFQTSLKQIYDLTIQSKNWVGADIWRFFKNDVKDLCIESDTNYRNILVLITDGYIYHAQSTDRIGNRTAYVTPNFLSREGFRKNTQWREKFKKGDYGLISFDSKLQKLEVLVLEVNPSKNHKNDEDIIRAYIGKWLKELNVKNFEIYNTDLPENTKVRIGNFFRN